MFARQPRPLSLTSAPAPDVAQKGARGVHVHPTLKRDGILYLGGALAAATAFSPTLHRAFDRIKDLEQETQLALVPGLVVLSASVGLHQLLRRQQAATAAAASAADARVMRLRAEELERLVSLERAVASSLDLLTLREHWRPTCRRCAGSATTGCCSGCRGNGRPSSSAVRTAATISNRPSWSVWPPTRLDMANAARQTTSARTASSWTATPACRFAWPGSPSACSG